MVDTTATQLLRYPETTDAPCDGDLHIQWFVEDVEAKLDSHDADLARTLLPPAVILSNTALTMYPVTLLQFEKLVSTTVEHQVGGIFVNLSANPREMKFPRTGYYQVGLEVVIPSDPDLELYYAFRFGSAAGVEGVRMSVRQHNRVEFLSEDNHQVVTVSGHIRVPDVSVWYFWDYLSDGSALLLDETPIESHRIYAFWTADL